MGVYAYNVLGENIKLTWPLTIPIKKVVGDDRWEKHYNGENFLTLSLDEVKAVYQTWYELVSSEGIKDTVSDPGFISGFYMDAMENTFRKVRIMRNWAEMQDEGATMTFA